MFDKVLLAIQTADTLDQIKLAISLAGLLSLIGIVAALVSMRVTVCNQIYARWQSLLFKFADVADAHELLSTTAYSRGSGVRPKAHFIAVGYINLFEEAFRYRNSRLLFLWRVLPRPFWISIVNSMQKQFRNFSYLRTYWEAEQDSFSSDFNAFVRLHVL